MKADKEREINALKREQAKASAEMKKVIAVGEKAQVGRV